MKVGNRGRSRVETREGGGDIITCEVPRITKTSAGYVALNK